MSNLALWGLLGLLFQLVAVSFAYLSSPNQLCLKRPFGRGGLCLAVLCTVLSFASLSQVQGGAAATASWLVLLMLFLIALPFLAACGGGRL